jgi:DNA phosphorothioation-dependent restriction protein DptG
MKVNILSLTLRDAQHLAWKTFKKFEKLDENKAAEFSSPEQLVKKVEELAKQIKDSQKAQESSTTEECGKMLSDLLFMMLVSAERQGVNLEDSFLQAVDELILSFVS